jgi:hypothetical protein
MMKTKTCTRCEGTGNKNTGVLHLGVPGLCFGCNGSGLQVWADAAEVTAELQLSHDRHIAELKQNIAECETGFAAGTIRERNFRQFTADYTAKLQALPATVTPAKKGEWRPVSRRAAGA